MIAKITLLILSIAFQLKAQLFNKHLKVLIQENNL